MHCIGVDVSKQELVTFDGKKERLFPNTEGLDAFARFLKRSDDPLVVFEPTRESRDTYLISGARDWIIRQVVRRPSRVL